MGDQRAWVSSPDAKNRYCIEGDVVWIELTQGKETCIDLADWEKVKPFRWYADRAYTKKRNVARVSDRWYVRSFTGSVKTVLHQLLVPGAVAVDHIDGDGLNNLFSNLRRATRAENSRNRRKPMRESVRSSSRYKGVVAYNRTGKFKATILLNLGVFESEEDAARAYDKKAKELFGEFARLNFPVAESFSISN